MTTSPFGTPNPFASPEDTTAGAAVVTPLAPEAGRSKRTPLLIGLVGVAVAATVGTGLFFYSQSGDDTSNETELALPADPDATPSPAATPTDTSTPLPTVTQYNGRNPFAAQVVEGGGAAAPASTPVATTAPVGGSSAFGDGAKAGAAGTDGANGATGPRGPAGPRGAAGAAGLTPQFATVTLVDGDPVTGAADFTLRSEAGQIDIVDLAVGEPMHVDEPGSWVEYEAMGVDGDSDGVLDTVTIQMGDVLYTIALGETVLLWQYTS